MTKRTIYIVDDHTDFRESTRFSLSSAGFDVQAFGDPQEAVEGLAQRDRSAAACLMLDVHVPRLSGRDVHDALVERGAPLPVIYMSGQASVPLAVRVMQKGAVSLLEKPFDDAALEAALDRAFASAAPAALGSEREQAHARFVVREAKLTPREREVLGYVILGVYNKNIADRIGLSIKTVELYRARGMAKMQAHSVAELTRMMVSQQA
ncbi:MAG TPA: response regulator [Albitalea sp.]|nr:response regulator [Albitalea sp.]